PKRKEVENMFVEVKERPSFVDKYIEMETEKIKSEAEEKINLAIVAMAKAGIPHVEIAENLELSLERVENILLLKN
ncbi:MAG: hypothetical protein FWG63_06445, partial [Defluviitaleaceae bacterium]|nr:hypothetical protein [Defluviitaleaceae bacterium]